MLSFMGRVNYTLMDRYLFTVTGRYDGTSRLATGNQWGFMPSAAVGWQMKNENFLKNVDWLNSLKLRVSWGKSGNNSIDHDITLSLIHILIFNFFAYGGKQTIFLAHFVLSAAFYICFFHFRHTVQFTFFYFLLQSFVADITGYQCDDT